MANNQAVQVTYLKDILFSEGNITTTVENRDHIFELQDSSGKSLGFASLYDLKAYVHDNEDEATQYLIKGIDGEDWVAIFEHPYFQRRKPQLVSMSTLDPDDDQQFFILKHGQKTGPYERYELVTMLDEKEIILTDMVSYNGGHTWMKLYQVENFDRRALKESDHLPGIPLEVISKANESVLTSSAETDAISGLAYLSNARRGKTVEREKVEVYQNDTVAKTGSGPIYKWLLVISILGIGYFLFHIKNQLMSPFKTATPAIGEQAQMLSPVEMADPMPGQTNPSAVSGLGERKRFNQVNDQGRSGGKFQTRSLTPIKPNGGQRKSFMESGKYQEIKNSDAPSEEDPNYFYDNATPMELDPVRSQVSKENFDESSNGTDGPIPSNDNLFESEVSN